MENLGPLSFVLVLAPVALLMVVFFILYEMKQPVLWRRSVAEEVLPTTGRKVYFGRPRDVREATRLLTGLAVPFWLSGNLPDSAARENHSGWSGTLYLTAEERRLIEQHARPVARTYYRGWDSRWGLTGVECVGNNRGEVVFGPGQS